MLSIEQSERLDDMKAEIQLSLLNKPTVSVEIGGNNTCVERVTQGGRVFLRIQPALHEDNRSYYLYYGENDVEGTPIDYDQYRELEAFIKDICTQEGIILYDHINGRAINLMRN